MRRPLSARPCCRWRLSMDRARRLDRLAAPELIAARHCSVWSDALRPRRRAAAVALTLASRSPHSCCSMHSCMSKLLSMCFAAVVPVSSVSSGSGENPLGLLLYHSSGSCVIVSNRVSDRCWTRCEIARDFARLCAVRTEISCTCVTLTIPCDGARQETLRE